MATDFVRGSRAVSLQLVAGKGHYSAVVDAIRQAKHSLWIATANLKELRIEDVAARPGRRRTASRRGNNFRSIVGLFDELCGRGVEIRILHAAGPSRPFTAELNHYPRLLGKGDTAANQQGKFTVRLCPRVHLKVVIVDGALMYMGSANFTGAGLGARGEGKRNFELGLVTEDNAMLDEAQGLYEHIWTGIPCGTCKLREICPAPLDGRQATAAATSSSTPRVNRGI